MLAHDSPDDAREFQGGSRGQDQLRQVSGHRTDAAICRLVLYIFIDGSHFISKGVLPFVSTNSLQL